MLSVQWRSEGIAEGTNCPSRQSGEGGKNGGEGGLRHLTTLGAAKLLSTPSADNPRYATHAIGLSFIDPTGLYSVAQGLQ